MKKLKFLTTSFLILVSCLSFGQWEIQNQIPDTITLRDVYFINDSCGWAAGLNSAVLKTIDAGISWTDESFTQVSTNIYEHYYCVYFLDNDNGWIGGEFIIVGGGVWDRIYHTIDGGFNWTQQYGEAGNSFWEILFIDNNKGFATGGIALFYTVDGGTNWEYDPMPASGISFPTELKGWTAGYGNIMHSDDGGNSWVLQYDCQGIYRLIDIYFTDNDHGWTVGYSENDETGIIFKTINGGLTWNETGTSEDMLNGVFFINNSYGWVIGNNGRIIYTANGGTTWNDQSVEPGYLYKIFITDNKHGWITGENGLYHADLSSIVSIENPHEITHNENIISISPNPFSSTTTITFILPHNQSATLEIQNMNGQVIETIVPENNNGKVEFTFDGSGLLPGIYFCTLKTNQGIQTRKMIKL